MNYYNNGLYNPNQQYVAPMMQPQMMYQQPTAMTQQTNDNNIYFICVESEKEVTDYPLAPNTTVRFWNNKKKSFYLKSADSFGTQTIKTFDYVERQGEDASPVGEYVTKDEWAKLNKEVLELKDAVLDIQTTPDPPRKTRRRVDE